MGLLIEGHFKKLWAVYESDRIKLDLVDLFSQSS